MENPVTRENLLESIEAGRAVGFSWRIATSNHPSLIKNVQSWKYTTSEYQEGQRRYE